MIQLSQKLEKYFQQAVYRIEPAIKNFLKEDTSPALKELLFYTIETGGKRLRPALTMLSCQAAGGSPSAAISAAAGLEIIHNYSLIIDDIIDRGLVRRNKPTLWLKYGESIAECLSIDFAASVFQAANHSKFSKQLTKIFAGVLKTIVEGEILDILFERQTRKNEPYITNTRPKFIAEKDYLNMIRKKTASLLGACCQAGAICAKARPTYTEALQKYGYNLGIAFQIQDDILDIFGEEKKVGKKIGKDIEEGKGGNIILLLALQELPKTGRERINRIMRQGKISKKNVNEVIRLLNKTKAQQKANELKNHFVRKAKNELSKVRPNKWTKMLEEVANFVAQREN